MDYELSFDRARIDRDVVHACLTTSYWSPGIRRDVVDRAIDHSLVLGVYEPTTGAQVDFARVVTDYASFAWVCDVFVLDAQFGFVPADATRMMEMKPDPSAWRAKS